jgi:hypothetical protein
MFGRMMQLQYKLLVEKFLHVSDLEYRTAYINAFPPPVDVLQSQVRKYMEEYDERVEKVGMSVQKSISCGEKLCSLTGRNMLFNNLPFCSWRFCERTVQQLQQRKSPL